MFFVSRVEYDITVFHECFCEEVLLLFLTHLLYDEAERFTGSVENE